MAAKETTRLCTLILRDHFGEISSRVGAELLKQGRVPLLRIARATLIKPQRVANALLVLIQHNIVWHWEAPSGSELFEINAEEVLMRLRYGRYLALTEDLFGESAAEVLSVLLDHGRVRAGSVAPLIVPSPDDQKGRRKIISSLISLMKEGYIKATGVQLQMSPQDRLLQFEQEATIAVRRVPATKKGPLSSKDLLHIKESAEKKLEEETEGIESRGFKKVATDTSLASRPSKRPKFEEEVLDEDVYLRIDPERFNIHIRNHIFVTSASQRYNQHAGNVLHGALTASLTSERASFATRSQSLSYHAITRAIPESAPKLRGVSLPNNMLNDIRRDDDAALQNLYVKEYVNILCAADNPSVAGRAGAFMSLTMSGGTSKRVAVEYALIAKRLRALVLDNLVRDKWGAAGLRIVNILRDCGKIDGEQIAKRAMFRKVEVQKYLKDMSTEGIISSLELSRTADRAPSRSIYLWFVDPPRTYSSLLFSLYRTLGNIFTRQHTELQRIQPLLAKRERTDVQENIDQYMARDERAVLDEYFVQRERLCTLAQRVDESVFVLRDLAKRGYADDESYVPIDPTLKS